MTPSLLSLPPSVLTHILEFAIYRFTKLAPNERSMPLKELKSVASVSKALLQSIRSIVATFRAGTLTLELEDQATSIDIEAVYKKVKATGASVRDLRLRLGEQDTSRYARNPGPGALESADIQWGKIFRLLPGLKRLDLRRVALLSRHLPEILETASTFCRHVEFLILPRKGNTNDTTKGPEIEKLMKAVNSALEGWYSTGYCQGLRQLTVPTRNEGDRFRCSTEFITAVTKFCPDVEYLDGYKEVVSFGDSQCEEMWPISLKTWEDFNASCTNLRWFSWAVVPFADSFFRVFGEHSKPQLFSLSMSANLKFNYLEYFNNCQDPRAPVNVDISTRQTTCQGYGALARNVDAVFKACPALLYLSIDIDYVQNRKRGKKYVNMDVYGDEFWETVASCCPLLKSATMTDASNYMNMAVETINTLTDRSLLALGSLKWLTSVDLNSARVTGNGTFEYIRCISKVKEFAGDERMISVKIGGHRRNRVYPSPKFYSEIVSLLEKLSTISEEDLGVVSCRTKPLLYILNPYESKVNQIWSEFYLRDQLMPLYNAVENAHPSLVFKVLIYGRRDNKFNRIWGLTLDWRSVDTDRAFFRDMSEEDDDDDTYRDAGMNEVVSDFEGDDGDDGELTEQDRLVWRAMISQLLDREAD